MKTSKDEMSLRKAIGNSDYELNQHNSQSSVIWKTMFIRNLYFKTLNPMVQDIY